MTVSVTSARTVAVAGTGAEQTIAFTFPILSDSDLQVVTTLTADGTEATLTQNTDYTLDNNGEDGGSITTLTPFIASTYTIQLIRSTPLAQSLDLTNGGTFDPAVVEAALDRLSKVQIEARELLDLLRISVADPAIVSGVDYQAYSSLLTTIASGGAAALTALGMSAFAQTVLDDTTASEVRATLGITEPSGTIVSWQSDVLCYDGDVLTLEI